MLNSFTGERSVRKVLVQKGHLCSWVCLMHKEGDVRIEISMDKHFGATKSKTVPSA